MYLTGELAKETEKIESGTPLTLGRTTWMTKIAFGQPMLVTSSQRFLMLPLGCKCLSPIFDKRVFNASCNVHFVYILLLCVLYIFVSSSESRPGI